MMIKKKTDQPDIIRLNDHKTALLYVCKPTWLSFQSWAPKNSMSADTVTPDEDKLDRKQRNWTSATTLQVQSTHEVRLATD